jgi:hypothetical protein
MAMLTEQLRCTRAAKNDAEDNDLYLLVEHFCSGAGLFNKVTGVCWA